MKESVKNRMVLRLFIHLMFLVILAFLPLVIKGYSLLVVNLVLIYVIVAIGYNLILGYAGQFSFAHPAFFGIGAYSCSLMMTELGFPFWVSMPLGGLIAATAGILVGFPSIRLGGIYLAMLTFAFSGFVSWILIHWDRLTKGAHGLAVPPPYIGTFVFSTDTRIYFLTLTFTILMIIVAQNLVNSKIGRALIAIRESEVAACAMGIDIVKYKLMAFALSAFYAGIGGCFFAIVFQFIHPDGFGFFELIRQASMTIIGGLGSIIGSIVGAIIMVVFFSEFLKELKSLQEILYGILLMVFVIFMPDGVVGLFRILRSRLSRKITVRRFE